MNMAPLAVPAANTPAVPATEAPPRLVRAAHEFEAQMMKELMQPLNRGSVLSGTGDGSDDGDGDSGSTGALGEFASEALGRALSEGGGFGIASSIVRQLTNPGHQGKTAPVTTNLHRDTVINSHQ
jgi:Rod binding domain-containing protein